MTDNVTSNDGCALVLLPDRTHVEMLGSDRVSFLHNLCTNDIKRLRPGQGCETFVTDVRGKTIGHILVFVGEEKLALESVPSQSETLLSHFDKYRITEDVQLVDQTDTKTEIALFGGQAGHVLEQAGLTVPGAPHDHIDGEVNGHSVSVRRVAMTTAPCFLLQSTDDGLQAIDGFFRAAGAKSSGQELWESARIESGWPKFGTDFTADNLPQELNRDQSAISFTKGCYLGQETVARIDALGRVNRLLVGLRFWGDKTPVVGDPLCVGGQEVGAITSVTFSPLLSSPLALGFLRTEHTEPGTRVACGGTDAEVVGLPIAHSPQRQTERS